MALYKNLIIIGDDYYDRICLLSVFSSHRFPPVIAEVVVDGKRVNLVVWHTARYECLDRLRCASYEKMDAILMCFSIDSPESIDNIITKRAPTVKRFDSNAPILLVATKKELRTDDNKIQELAKRKQKLISYKEGRLMAKKINAFGYIEFSAKNKEGVQEVVDMAARAALQGKIFTIECCHIL